MSRFNFSELTSADLDGILDALDTIKQVAFLMDERHIFTDDDELDLTELGDAIVEEMTTRALEDAGYKVNVLVGRGEAERYVRPDGLIGYAPPGVWEELS